MKSKRNSAGSSALIRRILLSTGWDKNSVSNKFTAFYTSMFVRNKQSKSLSTSLLVAESARYLSVVPFVSFGFTGVVVSFFVNKWRNDVGDTPIQDWGSPISVPLFLVSFTSCIQASCSAGLKFSSTSCPHTPRIRTGHG